MMRFAYILLIGLLPFYTTAQNHAINGSLEQYSSCPSGYSQLALVTGWYNSNQAACDYYNACNNTGNGFVGVPYQNVGSFSMYQPAASGNGYGGFYALPRGSEVATDSLIPLIKDTVYEVSISVALYDEAYGACNNIALYFSKWHQTNSNNTSSNTRNFVSFEQYGPVTDTQNWTRLVGYFIPDTNYNFVHIGGLLPASKTIIDTVRPTTGYPTSYYYFDSVVIKTGNPLHIDNYDTILCAGDTFLVNYKSYTQLLSNNNFSIQLSDNNGNFNNAVTIGQKSTDSSGYITCVIPHNVSNGTSYRIRLHSTYPSYSIVDNLHTISIGNLDSLSVSYTSNSPACTGSMLQFNTVSSDPHAITSWSGPNNFSSNSLSPSIPNTSSNNSGYYFITGKLHGCTLHDTISVLIKPNPAKPLITATTPVCQYDSLFLTANSTTIGVTYGWTGPNSYSSNGQNPVVTNIPIAASGLYTGFAILNGCVSSDTVTVQVKPSPDSVTVSSNSPLCTGDTLQLISDTSTGNVSYTWKGPNSFSANTVTTSINSTTTNTTGWYNMSVDLNGCSYIDSTYLVVNPTPLQPSISFNTPLCTGETLNLTASGSSNYSYQWYGPSSFSANTKNTTRSNAQTNYSGVYKVTAIENGCVSDTGFASITINPLPFAVITSNPADSICIGQLASFTALPGNVGSNPQYNWYVNTQLVGSGITYNTTTLNDQDVVYCEMTDNTKCSVPYTDQSNFLTMTVLPWLAPSVTISVNPTGPVQSGTYLTFTATATNAGNNPQYQWKRNGKDIVGATGSSWGALSLNNNDTITVEIISNYRCPQPTNAVSNKIVTQIEGVGINEIAGLTNLTLAPNPNRGQFILSGQLNHQGMVHISVMNMLGQVIYKTDSEVINNQLHQPIALPQVANGMYLLQLEVNEQRMNRKFRVE